MKKDFLKVVDELRQYMRDNMMPGHVRFYGETEDSYQIIVDLTDQVVYDFMKTYFHYENYEAYMKECINGGMVIYFKK